jgi:hypothetical protein
MDVPTYDELARIQNEYIVMNDRNKYLKKEHTNYISKLHIYKKHIVKTYTSQNYSIINAFLRNTDTLQFYLNYFPADASRTTLNILNIWKHLNYDYMNKNGLIDESDTPDVGKGSVDINSVYDTIILPLLETNTNTETRVEALTFFRTHMANYFLAFHKIIQQAPKMESIVCCYRGEKDKTHILKQRKNDSLLCKGFISGSLSKDVALQFINESNSKKSVLLELFLHESCTYLYIESISNCPDEEEVLISPFTQFTIVRDYTTNEGLQVLSLFGKAAPELSLEPLVLNSETLELNRNTINAATLNFGGGGLNRTRKARCSSNPIYKSKISNNGRKILVSNRTPFEDRMGTPIQFIGKETTEIERIAIEKVKYVFNKLNPL